jgi:hypothetical protein
MYTTRGATHRSTIDPPDSPGVHHSKAAPRIERPQKGERRPTPTVIFAFDHPVRADAKLDRRIS